MNADMLRDAITAEMFDYRHSKLPPSHSSYILSPASVVNCAGTDLGQTRSQPVMSSTVSQSQTTDTGVVGDVSLANSTATLPLPAISTIEVKVDGHSVEMPSASEQSKSDDVTMLSASSGASADRQLNEEELCHQDPTGNSSDQTDTTVVEDNWTNSAVTEDNLADCTVPVIKVTESVSNSLVVNTDPALAADAKARIKAALLNSGRRRQRLGESCVSATHYIITNLFMYVCLCVDHC